VAALLWQLYLAMAQIGRARCGPPRHRHAAQLPVFRTGVSAAGRDRPAFALRIRPVRRLWRFCHRPAGHPGAADGEDTSCVLDLRRGIQRRRLRRHHDRLLPCHRSGHPGDRGRIRFDLCDRGDLCAALGDHARDGVLFAAPSAGEGEPRASWDRLRVRAPLTFASAGAPPEPCRCCRRRRRSDPCHRTPAPRRRSRRASRSAPARLR